MPNPTWCNCGGIRHIDSGAYFQGAQANLLSYLLSRKLK